MVLGCSGVSYSGARWGVVVFVVVLSCSGVRCGVSYSGARCGVGV